MDPLAGIVGAFVIAAWAYNLVRDTGAILLDMNPDQAMAATLRQTIEADGDRLSDLHLWRLGPGHLGAIITVTTARPRGPEFYRARRQPLSVAVASHGGSAAARLGSRWPIERPSGIDTTYHFG